MVRLAQRFIFPALLIMLVGCGSEKVTQSLSAEDMFKQAKTEYDDGDYLDAIENFRHITVQYQGSGFASQAQFYLGESHFKRGEYLLAATEYELLKRNYAASPLVPEAQYKLALSYYHLSPKPALDQKYTRKAIDEFQTFVEYYPSNEHAVDADAKIKELNSRLAKKLYDDARQYVILDYYTSAIIYLNDVIEHYHDTEYAPLAELDKVEILIDRRKYQEANSELNRFYFRYPQSVLKSRADKLKERLEREWKPTSQATGDAGNTHLTTAAGAFR